MAKNVIKVLEGVDGAPAPFDMAVSPTTPPAYGLVSVPYNAKRVTFTISIVGKNWGDGVTSDCQWYIFPKINGHLAESATVGGGSWPSLGVPADGTRDRIFQDNETVVIHFTAEIPAGATDLAFWSRVGDYTNNLPQNGLIWATFDS